MYTGCIPVTTVPWDISQSVPIQAVYCVQLLHTITCSVWTYFQILYIFAQIVKYFTLCLSFFALFCPFFALLLKNSTRTLSRIGSVSLYQLFLIYSIFQLYTYHKWFAMVHLSDQQLQAPRLDTSLRCLKSWTSMKLNSLLNESINIVCVCLYFVVDQWNSRMYFSGRVTTSELRYWTAFY